jgi:hypothetical protein
MHLQESQDLLSVPKEERTNGTSSSEFIAGIQPIK